MLHHRSALNSTVSDFPSGAAKNETVIVIASVCCLAPAVAVVAVVFILVKRGKISKLQTSALQYFISGGMYLSSCTSRYFVFPFYNILHFLRQKHTSVVVAPCRVSQISELSAATPKRLFLSKLLIWFHLIKISQHFTIKMYIFLVCVFMANKAGSDILEVQKMNANYVSEPVLLLFMLDYILLIILQYFHFESRTGFGTFTEVLSISIVVV